MNPADEVDVDAQQWPSPSLAPSLAPPSAAAPPAESPAFPAPTPVYEHTPQYAEIDSDQIWAASAPALVIGAPSLPPSAEHYEPELVQMPIVTRAYEHTAHAGPRLIGTSATRVLAAAGWLGSAVGYTVAAIALSKSYRHITTENWKAALDEIGWLLPLMVSSFAMAYLGWVVWSTLAAINGHRVAPLASSPWLPPFAYLVGPAAAAAGSIYKPGYDWWFIAAAVGWVCIGHGFVLLSLRSSARRIGADAYQFTKLLWFPLAALGYRIIATVVLPDTSFNNTTWFAVLVAIDVTLMLATALAVWRAMHSFDQACARDRYSSVENQLPAFMAAAHR